MAEIPENSIEPPQSLLAKTSVLSPFVDTPVVCLNFKVPLRIRQQFKMHATRQNITMTELMLQVWEAYLTAESKRTHAKFIEQEK